MIYELGMLQQTCEFARRAKKKARKSAFLEAWSIHARNLLDIFYFDTPNKRLHPDDVIAEDFFDNSSAWRDCRPTQSEEMKTLSGRISKEIAHLTYTRTNFGTHGPKWPNSRITNEFRNVGRIFYHNVSADHIGKEFKSFFASTTKK